MAAAALVGMYLILFFLKAHPSYCLAEERTPSQAFYFDWISSQYE